VLENFDLTAQQINDINFEAMIRGEVIHTVFDTVIHQSSSKSKDLLNKVEHAVERLFKDDGLFKTRYGENYEEVPNSLDIIERLWTGGNGVKSLKELLPSYMQFCENRKKLIEKSFQSTGAKNIT
jgi:uncharacterized circularly permuted ATP-grasp superfamily protein